MEVKLEQKDAADWSYRGEGAANIVLAYTGSSPSFIGKVMRITKKARNGSSPKRDSNPSVLTEQERLLWRDVEELVASPTKEIAEQIYTQLVMSPLLGSKHVDAGMRVPVKRDFLECVEKHVIKQRPAWRVDVSVVDLERDSVIIMSDHSLFPGGVLKDGPCISVEIKPKCGFLPSTEFIVERNFFKRSATRFQMHQVLKLREQEISELSEYDPLDLFSGSKERIHKAINDLYTTQDFSGYVRIFFGFRTSLFSGYCFSGCLQTLHRQQPLLLFFRGQRLFVHRRPLSLLLTTAQRLTFYGSVCSSVSERLILDSAGFGGFGLHTRLDLNVGSYLIGPILLGWCPFLWASSCVPWA